VPAVQLKVDHKERLTMQSRFAFQGIRRAQKIGALIALIAALQSTSSSAQGIPVISVSELAQDLLVVKNLETQITQMTQQYDALTGNRSLGQILNNPSLTSYLPSQWQSVYTEVKSGQLQGLTSAAQQVANQEGMTSNTATQQRYNDTLAANKAITMQAYQASADRLQNIQSLMQQSDLTQDPAAKADLQNRLASENAMIQNEQTRLNLASHLQDVETTLAQKQDAESFQQRIMGDASPAQ
jgi:type IV secretion system protein VirB5